MVSGTFTFRVIIDLFEVMLKILGNDMLIQNILRTSETKKKQNN